MEKRKVKEIPHPFLNKCHYNNRWGLLGFCVWIVLGSYYCFDIPTALHNSLKNHFTGVMNDAQFEIYFSGLYSFYSFANIFLPFFSGKLRDERGDRLVLILMVSLIMIGQALFAYGVSIRSFFIMYVGRILSGWGMESISPTQTSFISPYFKDDFLGFVVGTNEFFATLGSIATMIFCPILARKYGLIVAVSSGVFFNMFSFMCSIVAVFIDRHAENKLVQLINYEQLRDSQIQQSEISERIHNFNYIQSNSHHSQEQNENENEEINNNERRHEQGIIEIIKSYPKLFWCVVWFHGIIYSSVLGFINISVGMLSERWYGVNEESEIRAGSLVALMWFITGCFTPIVGWLTDEFGGRAYLVIASAILCITSHLMIWYIYPFISLMLLGTSLGLAFSAAWTGIVYIVRPDALGKAYALVIAVNNISFSIVPLLVGGLRAYTGSYFASQIMLSFLGVIGLFFGIEVFKLNKTYENVLDGYGPFAQTATSIENRFPSQQQNYNTFNDN